MTAVEQKLLDAVHEIQLSVVAIEAACKPCSSRVDDHELILRGVPGNGSRPGLEVRVSDMTHSLNDMRDAHLKSARWQKRQLGAVVTALLAAMGLIVQHFVSNGIQ